MLIEEARNEEEVNIMMKNRKIRLLLFCAVVYK